MIGLEIVYRNDAPNQIGRTFVNVGTDLQVGFHFNPKTNPNFAGCVEVFLAAALSRVMRAAVSIPAVAAASVAVGGSVVGVVGLL